MNSSGIIYYYEWDYSPSQMAPKRAGWTRLLGVGLIALALGGMSAPLIPRLRLESRYAAHSIRQAAVPTNLQGESLQVEPVDRNFGLVIPKIGVNAAVIPSVNPTKPGEYSQALKKGIAHSSLSYFPNEDGTVYLFSHSTNYDWFVNDLNAVFYLLKNLDEDDRIVVYYKGTPYTYRLTEKRVVSATAVSYLVPQAGARRLILQTCWPPGSVAERLLIFADLVEERSLVL